LDAAEQDGGADVLPGVDRRDRDPDERGHAVGDQGDPRQAQRLLGDDSGKDVHAEHEAVDDGDRRQHGDRDPAGDAAQDSGRDADRGAGEQNARRESGVGGHQPSVLSVE
jgi:hypothetical protein